VTFLAVLRSDCIEAASVLDGPINTITRPAWVQKFLVKRFDQPDLRPLHLAGQRGARSLANAALCRGGLAVERRRISR